MNDKKPLLLFVVTEDWYFVSHRLPLAVAAREAGFEVIVATRVREQRQEIEKVGVRVIPINMARSGMNPLVELSTLLELVRIYKRERPDIVHQVAMKPALYGSLAAWLTGVPAVVNALAGLGYVFVSTSRTTAALRGVLKQAFRLLFSRSNTRVIVQNPDDQVALEKGFGIAASQFCLIRGSGVDLQAFPAQAEPGGSPLVILPARMLHDKGVVEFVDAATLLRSQGLSARFMLVGDIDAANPATIERAQLEAWARSGVVEWVGWRQDMATVLASSHVVCLPSYREGLPKALLEAAACARPLVATDVPGCREIVLPGQNGLLVPVRDSVALAHAIRRLVEEPALRIAMGQRGRALVEQEFSMERVAKQTIALYRQLIDQRTPA